ncbi:YbhB/YbcL family Raf kinase inhibitor-like protein [Lactobacillus sp. PV037]|uniref:YbhB/YbcL family Raf kinase inhibitor-like protein n=1 Tax=unclassified Lactobacillus TaxID=2620435 RepID=UPI0022409D04|nr:MULTISPECIES: YbhB/YbcL family Raf kinase inhibitor-like protein [unclassified Lactobacillus]QNQ82705.1 YbhB/YbcL family Raf kinase inhibitor-like protein [Lactobacillus sp. PV012]QNQ83176.1 YbhB/YbcL family Raf kinase inhibitor-like protein [Lactobacillus sp. PV037]
MKIQVPLVNGLLAGEYGSFAPEEDRINGKPAKSFPIKISDVPAGTKTFAIFMNDFDSVPVCGFAWIHWLAANIPGDVREIPADASRKEPFEMVQGSNSNRSKFLPLNSGSPVGYTGPQPPSGVHKYTLRVYALDSKLDLPHAYWLNEFLYKSKGHILEEAVIDLPFSATQG